MKTSFATAAGVLCLVVGSGVALGVPPPRTEAIDRAVARSGLQAAKGPGAQRRSVVPSSPIEVDIALKEIDSKRLDLEEELAVLDKELPEIEGRVIARGRAYYKQIHAGLLPAGGGFDELVDHAARVERLRLALTRDLEAGKVKRRRRDEITDALAHLGAERLPLEAQKKAFDAAKTYMRQANERNNAFDRAFQSSTEPPDQVTVYGADGLKEDGAARSTFAALLGKLPFPVAGRATVVKLEASGGSGPAIELHAPKGATARAVAAGRVAAADRDESGITIILDHGGRFFTRYGNLTDTSLSVGETVATGAAMGGVGLRRGESVLYFELLQDGRPVPPAPWFGL